MGFGKEVKGRLYTIVIDEEQRDLLQQSLDHTVEVDLEYMELTDDQKEEYKLLQGMVKGLPETEKGLINDFTA